MAEKKSNASGMILVVGLLACLGAGGYFLFGPKESPFASSDESLHVFYPKKTAFFFEFEPGEKLAKGFINFAGKRQEEFKKKIAAQKIPGAPAAVADASNLMQWDKGLIENFPTHFKPHFSVGSWPETVETKTKTNPKAATGKTSDKTGVEKETKTETKTVTPVVVSTKQHFLVVLPLKNPETSMDDLIALMEKPADSFEKKMYHETPYWEAKEPAAGKETALMILDEKFMVSDSGDTFKQVLDAEDEHNDTVYDLEANKKGLALLAGDRDGTLIVNNGVMKTEEQQARTLIQGAFGELHVENDTLLKGKFHLPVALASTKNEALKTDFEALLKMEPQSFSVATNLPEDTRFVLSAAYLDRVIQLGLAHFAPPQLTAQLGQAKSFAGMMQLDFDKDIIGLFNGEFSVAYGPEVKGNTPQPVVLMDNSDSTKQPVLGKLMQVASQMMRLRPGREKMGEVDVITLQASPRAPKVAVAPVGNKMVLGGQKEMRNVVKVLDKGTKSLSEQALYQELVGKLPAAGKGFLYMSFEDDATEFVRALAAVSNSVATAGQERLEAQIFFKLQTPENGPATDATSSEAAPEKTAG